MTSDWVALGEPEEWRHVTSLPPRRCHGGGTRRRLPGAHISNAVSGLQIGFLCLVLLVKSSDLLARPQHAARRHRCGDNILDARPLMSSHEASDLTQLKLIDRLPHFAVYLSIRYRRFRPLARRTVRSADTAVYIFRKRPQQPHVIFRPQSKTSEIVRGPSGALPRRERHANEKYRRR
ncbi:hypothetical protein EVAR_58157_1 [Eumeta japonica]|uniref:Uncharacterized protein n=1 Tax=Eumeta variegata TaxID=151549 RepID=A0A4C1WZ27_EUMVA|nr:hypothetical protein EVAR_58157_1 [Eumeta japonica]